MKVFVPFVAGVIVTISLLILFDYFNPNDRDLSILIYIENDTEEDVRLVTIESNNGQSFSCTLRFKKCSLAIFTGDATFKVLAHMKSGEVWSGGIGYSDPRSNRKIFIGGLKNDNT